MAVWYACCCGSGWPEQQEGVRGHGGSCKGQVWGGGGGCLGAQGGFGSLAELGEQWGRRRPYNMADLLPKLQLNGYTGACGGGIKLQIHQFTNLHHHQVPICDSESQQSRHTVSAISAPL